MSYEFIWIADPHLDHCSPATKTAFFNKIYNQPQEHVIVGGDISTAFQSYHEMRRLATENPGKKIRYILGNHDFWGISTIEAYRIHDLGQANNLSYMTMSDPTYLADLQTAIIGVDGFADAPYGDEVGHLINDTHRIEDFSQTWEVEKQRVIYQNIAERYLNRLKQQIAKLDGAVTRLLLVTHVPVLTPPHQRGDNPHVNGLFFNKRMGDYLKTLPYQITALVGHTHREQRVTEDNVTQISYEANYRYPELHVLNVEELFTREDLK